MGNFRLAVRPARLAVALAIVAGALSSLAPTPAAASTLTATSTTVTITSSANPAGYGELVILNATVIPASGTTVPTGFVTFTDGSATLGTVSLNSSGQAALSESTLSAGTHTIIATYTGSSQFSGSSSAPLSQVITVQGSTTMVFSTLQPAIYGQAVVFIVNVSANAGSATPTGTVDLLDGSTLLAALTLDSTGEAAYGTSSLTVGSHTMTAKYLGDGNFSASSAGMTETVNQATTTTALTSSANPATVGTPVTFTATITPSSGSGETGSVSFFDGSALLGTTAVSGGSAQLTTSSLAVGSHSVTARYSGDTDFAGSTSAALSEVVQKRATATALASSANPASFGSTVVLTATVSAAGGTPTGSVTFSDGSTSLGSAALSGGSASLSVSTFAVGTHSLTAAYSGDSLDAASTSAVLSESIQAAASTVALSSSANPVSYGTSITFTAAVTSSAGTPGGTVTFSDGTTALGSATLSGGSATFTTGALEVGNHNITASYGGSTNFAAATSAVLVESVMTAPSGTGVVASPNPALAGQAVTLTATVTASAAAPTGTVTFTDGTTTLGSAALNGSGQAALTVPSLAVGSHTITATYSGDSHLQGSSATTTEVVNLVSTSTALQSSTNPAQFGSSVSFTATVTSGAGTPDGSVVFNDGTTALATVALNGSGQAVFTTSALAVGGHSISAVYLGDGVKFDSSQSSAVDETIDALSTATTLTSSADPSNLDSPVTFTASVSATGGTPTGSVTFSDGSTALATVAVDGSGNASFSTAALAAGTHTITASFGGSSDFLASSSAPLTETVNRLTPGLSLTSSSDPSSFGQSVTFTVTASGSAGAPTGTVTLSDGSSTLASLNLSGGAATFSTASLSGGVHALSAAYSGDADYTAASASLTQQVNAAGTTTTLSASSTSISLGQSVTLTAHVTSAGGTPSGTVIFYDGGSSIASAGLDGTGTATVTTTALVAGSNTITATYSGTTDFASSTSNSVLVSVSSHPGAGPAGGAGSCSDSDIDTDLVHGQAGLHGRHLGLRDHTDCDGAGAHFGAGGGNANGGGQGEPGSTPGSTPSATSSATPSATGTPAPTSSPTASGTPTSQPTGTPAPTSSGTPTPTPAPTSTPTPTPTPSPSPCGHNDNGGGNNYCSGH